MTKNEVFLSVFRLSGKRGRQYWAGRVCMGSFRSSECSKVEIFPSTNFQLMKKKHLELIITVETIASDHIIDSLVSCRAYHTSSNKNDTLVLPLFL